MSVPVREATELARLCALDIGKAVTAEDVRAYLLVGEIALTARGFTTDECRDIFATLVKEMGV